MKKRGFTLIELLAVLVILGLIAVITVTAVSTTLKSYRNTLYDKQLKSIESAARLWLGEHMLLRPNSDTSTNVCVYGEACPDNYNQLVLTLKDLQDGGYLDKDLKNVKTKRAFGNVTIAITKNGNKVDIEVVDRDFFAYNVGDEVKIQVNSQGDIEDFYIIANSSSNSTYVKAISKNSKGSSAWCSSCSNNKAPTTIESQVIGSLNWDNVDEKRLITKAEFEAALTVMQNDSAAQKAWINGEYWTNETYGNIYAYYVDSNGTMSNYSSINDIKPVRPVIKVKKSYIKSVKTN